MEENPKHNGRWVGGIPFLAVGATLLLTYHALVVWPDASRRSGFDAPFTQSWAAIAITALLLILSSATVGTAVVFVLRGELRSSLSERLDVVVYALALAPAIYGVVAAMFTERRVVFLPFGAVTVLTIAVLYTLLLAIRGDRSHSRRPTQAKE